MFMKQIKKNPLKDKKLFKSQIDVNENQTHRKR